VSRSIRGMAIMHAAAMFVALTCAMVTRLDAQGIGLAELREMMAWNRASLVLIDEFEFMPGVEGRPFHLDATAWYGGAYNRAWSRAEGNQLTRESDGEIQGEVFYGRLITPYWDALIGLRLDGRWGDDGRTRAHLAAGVTGLAPLRFEVSPTLYLSQDGDLSARLESEYELLVTQKFVAAPRFEANAALQDVPEWEVGSGLSNIELGLRMRYYFVPEFAPYVGVSWTRAFGETADFARQRGSDASQTTIVAGLRVWW